MCWIERWAADMYFTCLFWKLLSKILKEMRNFQNSARQIPWNTAFDLILKGFILLKDPTMPGNQDFLGEFGLYLTKQDGLCFVLYIIHMIFRVCTIAMAKSCSMMFCRLCIGTCLVCLILCFFISFPTVRRLLRISSSRNRMTRRLPASKPSWGARMV